MNFKTSIIKDLLHQAELQNIFNKAVAGFILPDGTHEIVTLNTPENSVFDIASLTKVCPTSTLALKYILENKISIETKVVEFIPELRTNYRDEICVFHLLTHSLDYRVPMKTLRYLSTPEILKALFNYQFEKAPGVDFNYGNPASVLLGILLQRLTGKTLQEQGKEFLWNPLQMNRSGYSPLTFSQILKEEIIPTEICEFRGREIQGEVHDESAWVLQNLFPVGSAGVFSSVPDLLNFVQMLLHDGQFNAKQILPVGILKMISENAFESDFAKSNGYHTNACTALGFELNSEKFMGKKISKHAFGKTGFTGASIVADPEKNGAVILLSNFTYPKRESDAHRIHEFRAALADAFF